MYADENILYFDEDFGNVVFNCSEMGILNLDNNFDKDDPGTIIHVRLLACHIKFEKRKELKKYIDEELMPVAWHPNRWWIGASQKIEKK